MIVQEFVKYDPPSIRLVAVRTVLRCGGVPDTAGNDVPQYADPDGLKPEWQGQTDPQPDNAAAPQLWTLLSIRSKSYVPPAQCRR